MVLIHRAATHFSAKTGSRQKDDVGLRSGEEEIIIFGGNCTCHHPQIIFVIILKLYFVFCKPCYITFEPNM